MVQGQNVSNFLLLFHSKFLITNLTWNNLLKQSILIQEQATDTHWIYQLSIELTYRAYGLIKWVRTSKLVMLKLSQPSNPTGPFETIKKTAVSKIAEIKYARAKS